VWGGGPPRPPPPPLVVPAVGEVDPLGGVGRDLDDEFGV
jgi:hypothetical protein